jgi:transcriptional regulator with XRE-family HTH domain
MSREETAKHNVATNLKRFREVAGMTQKDLADAVGVSISAVSLWESEKTSPNANQLMQICEIFDKPPTVMFGVVDEFATREQEREALYRLYRQAPSHVQQAVDALLKRKE